jgi:hypothetical protein
MARGRTKRPPTVRNLELYHEIVCEHKTQAEIAAEFEISQPRVAAVQRKVHRWVEQLVSQAMEQSQSKLPAGKLRLDAAQKLHLAIAIHRIQLNAAYGNFLACFGGSTVAIAFVPILTLWDAGEIPDPISALLPPREVVRTAIRMAGELDDLACLAERCPLSNLPDEFLRTHAHTTQSTSSPTESCPAAAPV